MRPFTFMKYPVPLLLLLTLTGCATQPAVTSWLDPVSVATITSQSDPMILAGLTSAGQLKQSFARLSAMEINRMGARRLYLVLIPSISVDLTPQQQASFHRSFERIEIQSDDRPVALARHTGSVAELGIGEPALLPVSGRRRMYYPIERAELRAMASSNRLKLLALGVPGPNHYDEWRDGRRSLSQFLAQLPPDPSKLPPPDAP